MKLDAAAYAPCPRAPVKEIADEKNTSRSTSTSRSARHSATDPATLGASVLNRSSSLRPAITPSPMTNAAWTTPSSRPPAPAANCTAVRMSVSSVTSPRM